MKRRKQPTQTPLEAQREAFAVTLMASPLEPGTKHLLRAMSHHPNPSSLVDAKRIYAEAMAKVARERSAL